MIKKVRQHINQNEPLLFERSSPGKTRLSASRPGCPRLWTRRPRLGAGNMRAEIEGFPEVSEVEAIRHFTRLSTWNYAIDLGLYPLGSCTMKYNPRVNEQVARIEGLAWAHPYQPESLSQGVLEVMADARKNPRGDHRHGRGHTAAGRRRARRIDRHPADPRAAANPRAIRARKS